MHSAFLQQLPSQTVCRWETEVERGRIWILLRIGCRVREQHVAGDGVAVVMDGELSVCQGAARQPRAVISDDTLLAAV